MLDITDSNQTWEQSKLETINFKIELHGTGWDNAYPECIVYINEDVKWHGNVVESTTVDFDVDLDDDTEYELRIQYLNRNADTDVQRDTDSNIIKNKQIEISSMAIDDIELDYYSILYSLGEISFTDYHYAQLNKQDPEKYPLVHNKNTTLGAESIWTLKFSTPVYIWLLENL
jgi:hypothetical protein